jgi:hypothetical protein
MNTKMSKVVVTMTAAAVCLGGVVGSPPAQAQRVDPAGVGVHQFDDIGYVVAYRKEQMARDYVHYAAHRAGRAARPGR